MSDHKRGLFGKYRVERLEDPAGKHDECEYFVLDVRHDPLARIALRAYETAAHDAGYLRLATDLNTLLADNAQRLYNEEN